MFRMILKTACAAALFGGVLAPALLQATEPPCVACEQVPMLSKIPYLNRLFKNVGVATAHAPNDHVQIVWEWETAAASPAGECEAGVCAVKCDGASACSAKACSTAVRETETCEAKVCPSKACPTAARAGKVRYAEACSAPSCEAKCSDAVNSGVPHCIVVSRPDRFERIGVDFDFDVCANGPGHPLHAGPVRAFCAPPVPIARPLEAPLLELFSVYLEEVKALHEESREREMGLVEAIVEAQVENAKLSAKLELVEQQAQLAIENAMLKAKLEQAEERLAKFEAKKAQSVAEKTPAKVKR